MNGKAVVAILLVAGLAFVGASAGDRGIAVADESEFEVVDANLSDDEIEPGETVEVTAAVENVGDEEATHAVGLAVDGDVEATRTVTLDGNETATVTFERTFDEPGEYAIAVGGEDAGTLTVEEPGRIEIVNVSLPADWVRAGYETTVEVTVANPGDRPADRTLTVTADGEPVRTETVRVAPGDRQQVDVEFEAVEGTIAVDGIEAGSLAVGGVEVDENDDEAATDDVDGAPGFGVVAALLAVFVLALAVHRRIV